MVVAVRGFRAQQAQLPTAAVLGGQVQLMAPQEQLTLAVVVVVHTPETPETAVQGLSFSLCLLKRQSHFLAV